MTRAAIIAAFPGELKPLVRQWQHEQFGNIDLWRWRYLDQHGEPGEWIAACAGAGVDAATRAFAAAEQAGPSTAQKSAAQSGFQSDPESASASSALAIPSAGSRPSSIDLVISTGWAGALHKVIEPGLVYSICGVIDARTGEMTPAADWRDDVWLVTSPIVANEAEKRRLAAAYNAGLVDMEAAAVARLAAMRNIPFYCVKGVSDALDENLPDFNRFLSPSGQLNLARFTLFALFHPGYWHSLIRMGENSRKAAGGIAASVLGILDQEGTIRERNGYPDR